MYCKGLGAFIHYVIMHLMHHILYTRTYTGMCSTITEGKTQEFKSPKWNPEDGMLIRTIQLKRHEKRTYVLSLSLLLTVTQMDVLSQKHHKSVLSVKKHIMQYGLYVKRIQRSCCDLPCGSIRRFFSLFSRERWRQNKCFLKRTLYNCTKFKRVALNVRS